MAQFTDNFGASMNPTAPRIQDTAEKLKAVFQHGVQRGLQLRKRGKRSAGEVLRLGEKLGENTGLVNVPF